MGRLFSLTLAAVMLLPSVKQMENAQPVLFSMLFPQLVWGAEADAGEHAEKAVLEGEAVTL